MESPKPIDDQQASAPISRYQIQEELGRGAMGAVHKAFDPVIGRTVALKTILVDDHAPDRAQVIERLKQEAKAAGGLDHPNIITIYDVGEENGAVYLSMQFVQGITLANLLAEVGVPSLPTFLSWADQILAAVGFAHARGVIHRDLKPANLMVTEQGSIKVLDFGIAKIENTSLTQTGLIIGTPAYMAPEQIAGKKSDYRADIFSLGAVFYELLTREKAFPGDMVTALYKIVNEDPVVPSLINPAIPGWIDSVIRKALAKDPKDRFQTCEEMRKAFLEQSASVSSTTPAMVPADKAMANRPQTPVNARNFSQRGAAPQRTWPRLVLAFSLILVAGASWAFYVRSRTGMFPPLVTSIVSQAQDAVSSGIGKLSDYLNDVAQPAAEEHNVPASPTQKTKPDTSDNSQAPATPAQSGPIPLANLKPSPAVPNDHPAVTDASASAATSPSPAGMTQTTVDSSPAASPQAISLQTGSPQTASLQNASSQSAPPQSASPQTASPQPVQRSSNDQVGDALNQPVDSHQDEKQSVASPKPPNRQHLWEPPAMVDGYTRQDVPDLLSQANICEDRGEYRMARYKYRLALRLDPNNAQAREGLRRLLSMWQER